MVILGFGIIFACLLGQIDAKKLYWADSSCSGRPDTDWKVPLNEAFSMAQKAYTRLSSDRDTDFAHVFEKAFNVKKSDQTTYAHIKREVILGLKTTPGPNDLDEVDDKRRGKAVDLVKNILQDLASDWEEVGNDRRQESHVRFYCDNDKRWQPFPGQGTSLWDKVNQMDTPALACSEPRNYAATYPNALTTDPENPDQPIQENAERMVITICDAKFNKAQQTLKAVGLLRDKVDLTTLPYGIRNLQFTISKTIFHEFLHTYKYDLRDIPKNEQAYGWDNARKKQAVANLNNCDTYAYLGLWALIADRSTGNKGGFTLQRPSGITSPEAVAVYNEQIDGGFIKFYEDLTQP